ncbi:MAG TPA: Na+/H+ antiporter [Oxalicibacterium sp.]|jgi:Na+/H+ antiporter|nr:Na+/H+ antiporter [Oxalicibacterium sp.]
MDTIVLVLVMLLAVVASGYLVRVLPLPLPLPLVQIAMGAAVAGIFNHGVTLNPDIFFMLFLPPLLFLDGWRIPKDGLFRDRTTIVELAFGLVLFTVLGAGFLIHWLIPAMPLPVAFALAAIVSPTDPVAVSSITERVPMPRRLSNILGGESLLNDATGLVCFQFAVTAALTGAFSLTSATVTFFWVALVGLATGIGFTLLASFLQRTLIKRFGDEGGSSILLNLLIPFGAYLLAEKMDASGILAAVAAGITMSYVELSGRAMASTRVTRTAVWDMMQFALNGIVFVLLGEQLPTILRGAASSVMETGHMNPWWLAVYALAISIVLTVLRFLWVWVSLRLTVFKARYRGEKFMQPHWRLVLATSLAGVRGAITLAGVMTLPFAMSDGTPFPQRDVTIFLATAVILLSLVMASIGLPRVLQGLEFPEEPASRREEDRARHAAALAAIEAIQHLPRHAATPSVDTDMQSQSVAHVIGLYQHRLDHQRNKDGKGEQARQADAIERELRLTGLQAEREAIFDMARRGDISDQVSRKLVREIDLIESRYR